MSAANVEIVRRLYDAYSSGEYETALDLIAPDVEWDVSMRPDGKVFHGHTGAIEAVRTWTGTWEEFSFEVEEMIEVGERVVVVDRHSGGGKGSGMPMAESFAVVYELQRGKVVRATWFHHREEAIAAAERGDSS